jgi:hypothetical protein
MTKSDTSTGGKDPGMLRRVLGTIVALMLAGSGLGLLGALVYPESQDRAPLTRDADSRMRPNVLQPSRLQPVRLNLAKPIGHERGNKTQRILAPSGQAKPLRPTRS